MEKRCGLWDPAEAIEIFCAKWIHWALTYRPWQSPTNSDGRTCAERKIESAKSSTAGPRDSTIWCNLGEVEAVAARIGLD